MSTNTTPAATAATEKAATPPSRRKLRALGRKKRVAKLKSSKEVSKAYHDAKSKRATDKKSAFRKKKSKKK
jgi:hypothetical protein